MPKLIPPEVIEKIRKKREDRPDSQIPLYLPDYAVPSQKDRTQEQEETSGIYIIDLVN